MTSTLLSEFRQGYVEAERQIDHLFEELSPEQLRWKPAEDRWSVLQCIDHLSRVRDRHLSLLGESIRNGRMNGLTADESPDPPGTELGQFLIDLFQKSDKLQTVEVFVPTEEADPEEVVQTFKENNSKLVALAEEAEGLDLGRIEVEPPAPGLGNISLGEGFQLHVAHDARHLAQAEAVREEPGFPGRGD